MKCRPSCNHSSRRWISWGAWYYRCKGGLHYTWKHSKEECWFAPFSSSSRLESSTLFPPFETNVLPTTTHHLLHLAKQYSNALAVRRRQESMSLICLTWYKMKSRTAIAPLKSRADQNYLADPTATMWCSKANKYQQQSNNKMSSNM